MTIKHYDLIIIGAGPSGISAGYEAQKHTKSILFVELNDIPGGLARTISKYNCKFDIGPHRFYTKNNEVNDLYKKVLGEDLIYVNRLTRILYNRKYFNYPLSVFNALFGLGIITSINVLFSYFKSKLIKIKINNFEDWVISNFGRKLYEIFFKTYTEKVWGIPCTDISKDWASQRIKNLSLLSAVKNAIFPDNKVKSLVSKFYYPKYGAGFFYEKLLKKITEKGADVLFKHKLEKIDESNKKISVLDLNSGTILNFSYDNLICSNPINETLKLLKNKDENIIKLYSKLKFRSHIGIKLLIKGDIFPDNWIYIHSKEVKIARIANYNNFSNYMSYDKDIHPVTVEYFTFEDSDLWRMKDKDIIDFCISELKTINILKKNNSIINSFVLKSKNSYPLIDIESNELMQSIKAYLFKLNNIHTIGRCGMFRYNNQDHAILSGLYVIRNIFEKKRIDLWNINTDEEYLEEKKN